MKLLKIFITIFLLASFNNAQTISVGTDFVNRYIWRGFDLGGNTPSIQPNIKLTIDNFSAGFWGAYPIIKDAALSEIDIYASYSFSLSDAGALSIGFTDYINPDNGIRIFNFANHDSHNGPGAHSIELNAGYSGPESFPISFSVNMFVHNIPNNPVYFQLGYNTSINDVGLSLFVGATPGDANKYYLVDKFNVINTGLTVSKSIRITNDFSIPLFTSIILNPSQENLFFVVGFSL